MSILQRVVVPIATEEDAEGTCPALKPYLGEVETVIGVHVIEKGGGGIDKAPLDKRKEDAAEILGVATELLGDRVDTETRIAYGTDVVETLFDAADEANATAIAFRPRGGSRIVRFLSGDTASKLVTDPRLPVISLPKAEDD